MTDTTAPAADARHPLLRPRVYGPLLALVAVLNVPFLHYALRGPAAVTATIPLQDVFDRAELGPNYHATGGYWRLVKGELYSPGVKNNPLWLQARLPENVVVEFDARSESAAGDIKCEIFGDGRAHSTGYLLVMGGWNNTISVLARLDEHGLDRKERRDLKVEKGRTYRWRIERRNGTLRWYVDNALAFEWLDPAPLRGEGHDRFGFSSWDSDLYFDNLRIEAL